MTGAGRYHLLLTDGGRPVQHGWWRREETARDKFRRWVGEYGSVPDVRITLTDEDTGDVLAAWPQQLYTSGRLLGGRVLGVPYGLLHGLFQLVAVGSGLGGVGGDGRLHGRGRLASAPPLRLVRLAGRLASSARSSSADRSGSINVSGTSATDADPKQWMRRADDPT
ncbi:hypothetical protein ACWGLF_37115 [Streptomyces puniciscabiei]